MDVSRRPDVFIVLCVNGSGLEILSNKVHVRKLFCAGLDRGDRPMNLGAGVLAFQDKVR